MAKLLIVNRKLAYVFNRPIMLFRHTIFNTVYQYCTLLSVSVALTEREHAPKGSVVKLIANARKLMEARSFDSGVEPKVYIVNDGQ
jgi:hypothetical protein